MASRALLPVALLAVAGMFAACAAGETSTTDVTSSTDSGSTACVPGHQTTCPCFGGTQGLQICLEDGSGFGTCDCSGEVSTSSSSTGEPPKPCGDQTCAEDENCHTCEVDCGVCEPCLLAPSCDNAFVPKPNPAHVDALDIKKMSLVSKQELLAKMSAIVAEGGPGVRALAAALDDEARAGEHPLIPALRKIFAENRVAADRIRGGLAKAGLDSLKSFRTKFPIEKLPSDAKLDLPPMQALGDADPPGGTLECGAPLLRVGVSKIYVHNPDDAWPDEKDEIFCVIQAESGNGGEVRLLPPTPGTGAGKEFSYSLESGVIWGQKGPKTPNGNLQLTYDCIEQDDSSSYQKLVDSIGNAASQLGGIVPGDSGWILGTVGALAPVISGSIGLNGDDHLFNATQVVPLDIQLSLTNGGYWSIRRGEKGTIFEWDWEVFIQAWGCAEYGMADKKP